MGGPLGGRRAAGGGQAVKSGGDRIWRLWRGLPRASKKPSKRFTFALKCDLQTKQKAWKGQQKSLLGPIWRLKFDSKVMEGSSNKQFRGCLRGRAFRANWPKVMEGLLKNDVPILARLAPIGHDSPDWLRLFGAGSAARNLPSTRTGGQDDVSLNKLPQISFAKSLTLMSSPKQLN